MTVLMTIFPEKKNCHLISFENGEISARQNLDYNPFRFRISTSFACASVFVQ
jgi:hypothetical protein